MRRLTWLDKAGECRFHTLWTLRRMCVKPGSNPLTREGPLPSQEFGGFCAVINPLVENDMFLELGADDFVVTF